uniref:Small ribosomal subunit protein uS14 n=1 Tax=Oryctolagus cuniculus TaxID=9986 RepID=A0A5F9DCX5_RABIT
KAIFTFSFPACLQGSGSCRVCSNRHGLIRKYGLYMCCQCFHQYPKDISFVKLLSHFP